MRLAYPLLFLILSFSISDIAHAQLPPKNVDFLSSESRSLIAEVNVLRSGLVIGNDPQTIPAVLEQIAKLIDLTKQARGFEVRQVGGDAPTSKRLDLLIEGLERLHGKLSSIPRLIETKEFQFAANQLRDIAVMERAWSGRYDPERQPIEKLAIEYSLRSEEQSKPFLAAMNRIRKAADSNQVEEVRKLYTQLQAEQFKQLGANSSLLFDTLEDASNFEFSQDKLESAISLAKKAASIAEHIEGKDHWRVKILLARIQANELVAKLPVEARKRVITMASRYSQLEQLLSGKNAQEVDAVLKTAVSGLQSMRKQLGDVNLHYADALFAVANAYLRHEKLVEANHYFLQAASVFHELQLERNPVFLEIMNKWSLVCSSLGADERATDLTVQAIHASRRMYGEESNHYLLPLANFGQLFLRGEAYEKALSVFEKVGDLRFAMSGPGDEEYRNTMATISHIQMRLGRYDDVMQTLSKIAPRPTNAMASEKSRADLNYLQTMALLQQERGNDAAAEENFEQAILMSKDIYGVNDINYADDLTMLATHLMSNGVDPRIEPLLLEALKIDRSHLDRNGRAQTLQQRRSLFEKFRGPYFLYLTHAVNTGNFDRSAYEQVLQWKGATFRERWLTNAALHESQGTELKSAYDDISRRLSNFATLVDRSEAKVPEERQLMNVIQQKDDLWRSLAFTKSHDNAVYSPTIETIQSAIAPKGALVDFVAYNHCVGLREGDAKGANVELRFVAVLLRNEGPAKLVPLGPVRPVEQAISKWRRELQAGTGAPRNDTTEESPSRIIRRLLWEPLDESLKGVESIIVCPDGYLNFIPWYALPSREKDRYLIEDFEISTVPVAQFVSRHQSESEKTFSMLLLGNPKYQRATKRTGSTQASLTNSGMQFGELPGTEKEAKGISKLYNEQTKGPKIESLIMADSTRATEDFVRQTAPKVRYLHLATHGFYRPDAWRSDKPNPQQSVARDQLRLFVPETMSGIALAGANNSLAANWSIADKDTQDDGILTALEVTTMDLSKVDLVVLSACETSIGLFEVGDEGLGLQQSFQLAGARATISSLWKIDDSATQVLMVELYRNLWEKKMPQSEALRQAQLTMLNDYDPAKQSLRPRGLKIVNSKQPDTSSERLQPFYWASFFLSGDRR